MAHVGVEVLLLVEPGPAHVALEGLVPGVDPPVVDELEVTGEVFPTFQTSPGPLAPVHRALVY